MILGLSKHLDKISQSVEFEKKALSKFKGKNKILVSRCSRNQETLFCVAQSMTGIFLYSEVISSDVEPQKFIEGNNCNFLDNHLI